MVLIRAAGGGGATLHRIDAEGNLPDGTWEALQAADAIIMGSPTYMGGVSWQFKKFADASSKLWFSQTWKHKVAAGFTNSASMNGEGRHAGPPVSPGDAARHGVDRDRHVAIEREGGEPERPELVGSVQRRDGGKLVGQFARRASLPGDLETARRIGARIAAYAARARMAAAE